MAVIDYGDCLLDYGNHQKTPATIEREASKILASGAFLMSMGGDHFVTWPLLKAHAAKHGQLALVQFDAHQDTWFDDGKRIDHGSFVGRAVRDGVIDPTRSIQVGIRTHAPEDCGIRILYGYDVEDMSAAQIAATIPIMSAMRPAMSPSTSIASTRHSRPEPERRWPADLPAPRCSRCFRNSGGLISRAPIL
jgi:agmatinase